MVDGSFQRNWEVFSVLPVIRSSEAISGFRFSEAVVDILHVDSGSARIAFSAALSAPLGSAVCVSPGLLKAALGQGLILLNFLAAFVTALLGVFSQMARMLPYPLGSVATFDEIVLQSFFCLPLMQ